VFQAGRLFFRERSLLEPVSSIKPGGDSSRITMTFSPRVFLMIGSLIAASAIPLYADGQQQKPNKLEADSTPAYDEHNTTSPASANSSAVARDNALKPAPGKVSAGKEPSSGRKNGMGFDAGASSMSKKP
jgi:hypothetical protein